ncbi:dihydropteroate synthase [Candidatus Peregrinibacteria bacterium]|nr:MAG: dihydropteroate synthase [Candidatus Peregrinibacteria bacterium]
MKFDLSKKHIMGILNVTPDSFSDGGRYRSVKSLELIIKSFIEKGVSIIDVGGESTGPGSTNVSEAEELERVRPVIDLIAEQKLYEQALFSIDTYKASVAEYALKNGFGMVNDVTALRGDPRMIDVLLQYKPYVVLMYSKDSTARTTATAVEYDDVIETVAQFLNERIELVLNAGFPKDRIIIDPGMGAFVSANPDYSYQILDRLPELKKLGYPILVGVSRKSFLGGKLEERDPKSWELSQKALADGASIVRLHQVQ